MRFELLDRGQGNGHQNQDGGTTERHLALACGLILDTVTRGRTEAKRLAYLAIPATRGTLAATPDDDAAGLRPASVADATGTAA